jgi:hypothetical protein
MNTNGSQQKLSSLGKPFFTFPFKSNLQSGVERWLHYLQPLTLEVFKKNTGPRGPISWLKSTALQKFFISLVASLESIFLFFSSKKPNTPQATFYSDPDNKLDGWMEDGRYMEIVVCYYEPFGPICSSIQFLQQNLKGCLKGLVLLQYFMLHCEPGLNSFQALLLLQEAIKVVVELILRKVVF